MQGYRSAGGGQVETYFNLLKEAWIPVVDKQARQLMVSLEEAITRAHEISRISAEYPTVTGSLYLLTIAFASSVYLLENLNEWERLHQQGRFVEELLLAYCNKWQDRFFLFDDNRPFYQDPKIGLRDKDVINLGPDKAPEPKGIKGLLLHLASGSNATLFDHSFDEEEKEFQPDEVARFLIMVQAYSLGGMSEASIGKDKYYKDAPFGRGVTFLSRGETLFETLTRNMIPKDLDFLQHDKKDLPSWEKDDAFDGETQTPTGIRDLLTWQSRRIFFMPEELLGKLVVRKCMSAPGLRLPETFANPFYMNDHELDGTKLKIKPMRFQMDRVIWRDSGAILDPEREKRDKAISKSFMETLQAEEILQEDYLHLALFGMCTEPGQKKAYTYQEEEFNAPSEYINNPSLSEQLKQALSLAESIRKALYFATYELANYKIRPDQDINDTLKPDKKDVNALVEHFQQEGRFWSALEIPFYQLLMMLPTDSAATVNWQEILVRTAKDCLAAAAELAGDDYSGLKARAKAENKLGTEIYRLLNPDRKEK